MKTNLFLLSAGLAAMATLIGCADDPVSAGSCGTTTALSDEWYAGGKLGTVFNSTSSAYEQSTPAVDRDATMAASFLRGETFFEDVFIQGTDSGAERQGLGPLYVRNSCIACHPGYGHGRRMTRYRANDFGNGYLLVITDANDNYLSSLTGMPQTKAVAPFKAPLDESQISISWQNYTDEWGNRFPDGTTYSLIYPEVSIPESAYYVPLEASVNGQTVSVPYGEVKVRLESTIGIYGTGLLDAIPDDSIIAQYHREAPYVQLNPSMYKDGQYVGYYTNTLQGDGTKYVRRLTYALSRGPLEDGPGANAIWNITNVTRSDRRYHYMTAAYARKASQDADVQRDFYRYFPQQRKTGNVEQDIYRYLMAQDLPAEMSDEDYIDLMVWHRGLAVPAARDLDDPQVQQGKQLFTQLGCATCHRPSWTTGDDVIRDPNNFFTGARANLLPRYPHQKIWPYSDLIQHRLNMVNDIRTGWCRTTPLWGRGLSQQCTGASDRLHDCRARNVIEAIMWHGCPGSDARATVEKFRQLSASEREAVVAFVNAI